MVLKIPVVISCAAEGFIYCIFNDKGVHLAFFSLYWESASKQD